MKRNRNKRKKSERLTHWQQMEQKRMFAANQGFMQAVMDLCFSMRWRFGWQVIRGINPMTGKRHEQRD